MPDNIHSTGRGGAGNIGEDTTSTYVDGSIVQEGVAGESDRPEYSAGRGGAGNMVGGGGSPRVAPSDSPTLRGRTPGGASEEVIPEPAMRSGEGYENFHTGRGGQGNVHKDKYGGHSSPQRDGGKESLVEKAKHAVGLGHKHEDSPLKNESTRS